MDVYYFTEMPYAEFPESEAEKFPSMRLTFPNTYFDPRLASELFRRYLDEYQYAEEVGFDGLMINEHHNTPVHGCRGQHHRGDSGAHHATRENPHSRQSVADDG